ncbi:MAG: acetyl-CoA C-acetyltransferase [Cytophagia bacterium]|nr:MAG: acetyl-CoA C-acetyltransferase [Runella sp.]TAG20234.1 MAG: acetyl-CoA C-acetyltransferase [Cytophagales bacterium]TAG39353.1 MAG: acetyl-CoA C-acetyltransferase [Cytophagia bacterium]TAG51468.1 MAG: acetyl-CoA C-acetyltransferase [Runella slithyformis]TAG81047.1 MAG: acetyl-CoA C-acetyltransferase [Cytophagales bacterium]
MAEALIYDAARTPRGRGKSDGSLHEVQPIQLLTSVLKAIQQRNNLDTSYVDDVIMGCVTPVGEQGADIARTAVLEAGYAESVAGVQLNRFCSSGLEAINQAAAYVMSGQVDLMVAGGVESMSRVPMGSDGGALMFNPNIIGRHNIVPQGISADLIATKYGYSRTDVDTYAAESYRRASAAQAANRFEKSLVPYQDELGITLLNRDEGVRPGTTVESLGTLKPAFEMMGSMGLDALALMKYADMDKINHVHHAGNSSQIVDGAAGLLIGSKEIGEKLGLKARAKIKAFAIVGSEPTIMLTGPVPAAQKVLKKAGMSISDIDLFEVNEAFAAVPMFFMEQLGVDISKVNVNGGAIALGHPLGATGAIISATLIDEMERTGKQFGLSTLCIGGGMGIATIFELI